ncbi:Mss4-like protein [Niveomyces insectorum RCEF 264]|uniref:Mss4-like protein n=1 Tax=Niveomyces insectorum RCEF 264 TaxID=1081102 RepID=A0A167Q8R4_9HYPO|nr:Mss4-like protein [Niveomyces insectorum RCEF 264]
MSTVHNERKPFTGSCLCGFIKYIVYLRFPPALTSGETDEMHARNANSIRLRKCNCNTCHKMGIFHLRLADAANDFILLSPLDPFNDLGDYLCGNKILHWFFCKTCGVRCFFFMGEGRVVDRDIDGETRKVWVPAEDFVEEENGYLSVNATSLDPGQEGLDLREWHEKGWIHYLDMLDKKEENSWERPHRGGMY